MKTLSRLSIFVLLILNTSCFAASEVKNILDAHFAAVGGLERLSEIRTIRRSGTVELTGTFGKMLGTAEEAALHKKKSYAKTEFGEVAEITVWNGEEGWKKDATSGTTKLLGDELEAAKSAVYIDPLQSTYEEYGSSAFQQGEDEIFNGDPCTVLKIHDTEIVYYLNKTSHLVVGMKMPFSTSELEKTTMVIHYADYAEYKGVMFPDSLKIVVGDGTSPDDYTYSCTYKKTEVDVTLDETIFEKP